MARATQRGDHLTREDRARLLRYMLLMRASEERALTLYKQGKVPGSFYDGCGQEAISVGAAYVLGPWTGCASCTATWGLISCAGSPRTAISPTTWDGREA